MTVATIMRPLPDMITAAWPKSFDCGKIGSAAQQHAETTAVLASIALQYGVEAQSIIHAVAGGPLAMALELALPPDRDGGAA